MSVNAEKFVWRKRRLNPSMKYVMLAIARNHDALTDECAPKLRDLCLDTSMSVSTVRRNIEALVELNLLEILDVGKCHTYRLIGFNINESKRINKPTDKTHAKAQINPESPESAGEMWNIFFDKIWSVYPRKVSKSNAQKAFAKLCPTQEMFNNIVHNINDRIIGEWSDINPKYIPHLATYLNGERWKDELEGDGKQNMEGDNEYLKGL